jgi:hypothetical protein
MFDMEPFSHDEKYENVGMFPLYAPFFTLKTTIAYFGVDKNRTLLLLRPHTAASVCIYYRRDRR